MVLTYTCLGLPPYRPDDCPIALVLPPWVAWLALAGCLPLVAQWAWAIRRGSAAARQPCGLAFALASGPWALGSIDRIHPIHACPVDGCTVGPCPCPCPCPCRPAPRLLNTLLCCLSCFYFLFILFIIDTWLILTITFILLVPPSISYLPSPSHYHHHHRTHPPPPSLHPPPPAPTTVSFKLVSLYPPL
jgi:hypothetical protein